MAKEKSKVKQTKFVLTLVVIAIGLAVFNLPRAGQIGVLRNILFGLYIWIAVGVSAWISLRHLKEYTLERKITACAVMLFLVGFGGYFMGPALLDIVSEQKTVTANLSECKYSSASVGGSREYYVEIDGTKYSLSKEDYDAAKKSKSKKKELTIEYYPHTRITSKMTITTIGGDGDE